MEPNSSNLP